jgi:transposase
MDAMPKRFPPEFKADVVRVARRGDLNIAEVAADFDISVQSVQRWKRQADIDEGIKDGLTSAEQAEAVQLRRRVRQLEMENEMADSTGQRNKPCEMSESKSREDVNARTPRTPIDGAKADGVPAVRPWLAVNRYRPRDRLHFSDGGQDGARTQAPRGSSFRLGAPSWMPEHLGT